MGTRWELELCTADPQLEAGSAGYAAQEQITAKEVPFTLIVNSVGYKTQDVEVYEVSEEAIEFVLNPITFLKKLWSLAMAS